MKPLSSLAPMLANIRGLLADIDDTISTEGRITAAAYGAMERLRSAGFLVIPVTGRPAGWCDHIARMWPVDAVVGENGAFYMRYDEKRRKLVVRKTDGCEPPAHVGGSAAALPAESAPTSLEEAERRGRLQAIGEHILREVPGSAWASDQSYRLADIAIDFREDVPPLTATAVERIAELMREEGLTAKVSSIHVNGWFGSYDKLGMTRVLLREQFGMDLESTRAEFVFVGDSPNDAPMFEFFPLSVGVANVADFAGAIAHPPKYVTRGRSGAGFVELAELLIEFDGNGMAPPIRHPR